MKRRPSSSTSRTCASRAGRRASGPCPASRRSGRVGWESAAVTASASRVGLGNPTSRSCTSSRSSCGTGSGSPGAGVAPLRSSARPSSNAWNALPLAMSWSRRRAGRESARPMRACRRLWIAPRLIGATSRRRAPSRSTRPGGCRLTQAVCDEETGRLLPKPAPREGEHGGRRRVEPLNVVYGDEQRTVRRASAEGAEDRDGHRALVRRGATRALEQEGDSKCVRLGRREVVEQLLEPDVEQIAEAREGEPRLGRRGLSLEDPVAEIPTRLDACLPEGGLADAGLADEDERSRAGVERLEKLVHGRELFLTTDDLDVGRGLHLPEGQVSLQALGLGGGLRRDHP